MATITYTKGDATQPIGEGNKIIVHICNDIGGWGKGFVLALSRRWKVPEKEYRTWHKSGENFALGETQFVQVEPDLWIGNMIAQHKIYRAKDGTPPIREAALSICLEAVKDFALANQCAVHMPRIGCGLAGGEWENIGPIVEENLAKKGVEVVVYDFG